MQLASELSEEEAVDIGTAWEVKVEEAYGQRVIQRNSATPQDMIVLDVKRQVLDGLEERQEVDQYRGVFLGVRHTFAVANR